MLQEIKRIDGSIIHSGEFNSLQDCVMDAISKKISLRSADLLYANLRYANLRYANLQSANLQSANLRSADLRYANLRYANLRYANLQYANLQSAENINDALGIEATIIHPKEGSFIGWKKCANGIVLKLLIPENARRSNGTERKCRAEFVKVLDMSNNKQIAYSVWDGGKTEYKIGETVKCDNWDTDRWNTCSGGIHFFMTKKEAENYHH